LSHLFRRLALALAAAACLAAAAGMVVIAAGYALFAALRDDIGPAGASAVVALAAAVVVALMGLALGLIARGRVRPAPRGRVDSLADRVGDLVRDRPIAAAGVAAAAGWILTRSPALASVVATLISERGRGRKR
jgi:hypothetical protein